MYKCKGNCTVCYPVVLVLSYLLFILL